MGGWVGEGKVGSCRKKGGISRAPREVEEQGLRVFVHSSRVWG